MTGPAPRQKITPEQYAKLQAKGWSDQEIQADGLDLPATATVQSKFLPTRQESGFEHALGAVRSTVGGLTGGFNDEISGGSAAVTSLIQQLLGGQMPHGVGDAYTQGRDAERSNQAQYQSAHPTEAMVTSTLGSTVPLALSALATGGAAPAATAAQAIGRGIVGTSAYAGADALGHAEGPPVDQMQAVNSAMRKGAIAGGLVPAIGITGGAVARAAGKDMGAVRYLLPGGKRAFVRDLLSGLNGSGEPTPPTSGPVPPVKPVPVAQLESTLRQLNFPEERIQRALWEQFQWGAPPEPPVDPLALGRTAARMMAGQPPKSGDIVKLMQSAPAQDLEAIINKGQPTQPVVRQGPIGTNIQTVWKRGAAGEMGLTPVGEEPAAPAPKVNPNRLSEKMIAKRVAHLKASVAENAVPRTITAEQYDAITKDPANLEALLQLTLDRLKEGKTAAGLGTKRLPQ